MNILLFGKDGQLGQEFIHEFGLKDKVTHLLNFTSVGRQECDLSDAEQIRTLIQTVRPELIINAAAYTAVDQAETQSELAHLINAIAPSIMAEEAQRLGSVLVHYSTDYVFDGLKKGPYLETDACRPQSVYGATKLLGEGGIRKNCSKHLIFRTSWVFSAHGNNFLKTILKLAKTKSELKVINDQCGAPTSTSFIAQATMKIIEILQTKNIFNGKLAMDSSNDYWGIFNLVASEFTSWHGYARYLIEKAIEKGMGTEFALNPVNILSIPSKDYPQTAKRPLNSVLSMNKLGQSYGVVPPNWESLVDAELSKMQLNEIN